MLKFVPPPRVSKRKDRRNDDDDDDALPNDTVRDFVFELTLRFKHCLLFSKLPHGKFWWYKNLKKLLKIT